MKKDLLIKIIVTLGIGLVFRVIINNFDSNLWIDYFDTLYYGYISSIPLYDIIENSPIINENTNLERSSKGSNSSVNSNSNTMESQSKKPKFDKVKADFVTSKYLNRHEMWFDQFIFKHSKQITLTSEEIQTTKKKFMEILYRDTNGLNRAVECLPLEIREGYILFIDKLYIKNTRVLKPKDFLLTSSDIKDKIAKWLGN